MGIEESSRNKAKHPPLSTKFTYFINIMHFFQNRLAELATEIETLQTQVEKLETERKNLALEEQDFVSAFGYLEELIQRHQDNPEILKCVRDHFEELLPSDTETNEETEEPSPEPQNSICLHQNPSVFWDSHADSMRLFLSTNADAQTTGEKAVAEGLATRYRVNSIDSESFCLTLSGVSKREQADKILDFWLNDEAEDMADQEEELAGIEPDQDHETHHSTVKLASQEEAELFGRHAVDRKIISSYSTSSDGQVHIFGMLYEQEFNKYKIEFDLASEDPIELALCDRQAAENFSKDLTEKNLATEFEIGDDGKLTIIDPKEPEEILRLLEIEPHSKAWIGEQAYHRNDCLVMGFKTKKLRNQWAKFFDIPFGGNAHIEPMDASLIDGLKATLKITFYGGIEKPLERIQLFDFTLTPEENEGKIKEKSEEIGIQFSSEQIEGQDNIWMLYAKRPLEQRIALAGASFINGKYKVSHLGHREFDTLDLAAEALWHHRNAS